MATDHGNGRDVWRGWSNTGLEIKQFKIPRCVHVKFLLDPPLFEGIFGPSSLARWQTFTVRDVYCPEAAEKESRQNSVSQITNFGTGTYILFSKLYVPFTHLLSPLLLLFFPWHDGIMDLCWLCCVYSSLLSTQRLEVAPNCDSNHDTVTVSLFGGT